MKSAIVWRNEQLVDKQREPNEYSNPQTQIAAFCRKNQIRKLSLFGSVLTGRFRSDSDVDVLVDFEPGHMPGLLGMARMERELGEMLDRKIDLRTAGDLSRYFRDEVVSAVVLRHID